MKAWFKRKYLKIKANIKAWFIAFLAMLGIIVGTAYAENKDFTWTNPTTRIDGSALDIADIASTRIYCDGDTSPTLETLDNGEAINGDFGIGDHSCFATTVDTDGQESDPSNTVNFTITPARPNPPVLSVQ